VSATNTDLPHVITSAFGRWEERFHLADTCPWPGPRPLTSDDRSLLIGREADSANFRNMVDGHRLVILDGKSGIGKTSLLQAKLIPDLRDDGYVVAACRDWSDDSSPTAHEFLATKVRAALFDNPSIESADFREGAGLFFDMAADPRKFVIILDQFEELIRYSEERTAGILSTLVTLNRKFPINVVVSLRSEYLHELRPLERDVKPFSFSKYELEPVSAEFATELICAPNAVGHDEGRAPAIEVTTAKEIARLWTEARLSDGSEHGEMFGGVGLLHLQALLYALHAQRSPESSGPIGADDLQKFSDAAAEASRSVFAHGMIESVEVKLDRCRAACADLADPYLVEGVRSIIARCAPHMSSAGFKLQRETAELAEKALDDELENLRATTSLPTWRSALRSLITSVRPHRELRIATDKPEQHIALDVVAHGWREMVRSVLEPGNEGGVLVEIAREIAAAMMENSTAVASDKVDPSCGPMMALHPGATLLEELRRFAFAIAWMERSSLIRLSTPSPGKMMVSLIHDRFGEGLNAWAATVRNSPAPALYALTAPKGADFFWKLPIDEKTGEAGLHPLLHGRAEHRVLPNLRWKGGWVSADFTNVLFVNCDLRGTMFSNCTFRGVAFVNCLLDGAMFDECTIVGAPQPPRAKWDVEPSRFEVEVTSSGGRQLVDAVASYRGVSSGSAGFFSPLPGVAAVPLGLKDEIDPDAPVTAWEHPRGGLTVYGGRVSTLIVRSCVFRGEQGAPARLALRFMAGTGFDVVEQRDFGDIEIHGSAVRHVTVTIDRNTTLAPSDERGSMRIFINGSSIAQVWIGDDVPGSMEIVDCQAAHVWNSSHALVATVRKSPFHGLVGCSVPDIDAKGGSVAMEGIGEPVSVDDVDPNRKFRERAIAMDYVSDPARRIRAKRSTAGKVVTHEQETPT
jgi:hypothetical protein